MLSPLDISELTIYFEGTCEDKQFANFCAQARNFDSISTIEKPDLWKTWPEQRALLAVNLYFFRDPPNLQKLEQDFVGDGDSDLSVHVPASNYAKDKSLELIWHSGKPHLAIVSFVPYPFFVRATGKISSLVDVQDASLIITSPHDGLAVLTPTRFRIRTKQARELEIDTSKLEKISVGKRTAYLYKFEKPERSVEEEKTLPPK